MSADPNQLLSELGSARERFLALVAELRPELHRYCSKITGSVIEGEDIVQDTLAKAFYAISLATEVPPLRPWLFRIAHNTAVDLRSHERRVEPRADLEDTPAPEEPFDPAVLRASLGAFLELPLAQRSAVILKDVLGHSLEETADTMAATVPAVKAALARGRARLRASSTGVPAAEPAVLAAGERRLLEHYVALFNARDWDALKALIGEECRLDLLSRSARRGYSIHEYFTRYAADVPLRLVASVVEGRPAALVYSEQDAARPAYFMLFEWQGETLSSIRDYRYARYVASELELASA